MNIRYELQKFYDALPEADIPCKKGCGYCCNPAFIWNIHEVLMAYHLTGKFPKRKIKFHPVNMDSSCIYRENGLCSIYEHRPFMCRIYGAFVKLAHMSEPLDPCPHGILRTTKPLTDEKSTRLLEEYVQFCADTAGLFYPINCEFEAENHSRMVPKGYKVILLKEQATEQRTKILARELENIEKLIEA